MNDTKELKELNKNHSGGHFFNIEKNQCLIFLFCNLGINFILNTFFKILDCNYDVVDLSILIMYDVQYDATTYGSKINWKYVFANHKGTTRMLNALALIFDSFHSKKICGFINLFLKLNMYVSSSRCRSFKIQRM